jgi:hypothetical protein
VSNLGASTLVFLLAACSSASSEPKPRAPADAADRGPVVVELFTSQGCSSCPPADRVLATIARDGRVGERAVVPLAFHVDYWDDLGWADRFAQPAWSQRQRAYAGGDDGRVYTPQLVIGGRGHVVGSNLPAIRAAIASAPAPARLAASVRWQDGRALVTATAPAGADAWVAIYEDGLASTIERGENAGRTLEHEHVVRRFERVAPAGTTATLDVALAPGWRKLGAVALAQGKDRAIVGSRLLDARR